MELNQKSLKNPWLMGGELLQVNGGECSKEPFREYKANTWSEELFSVLAEGLPSHVTVGILLI